MVASSLSFLTPYWSGAEMMRLHLASIRRFHPDAPILVSKRDGGAEEMSAYRREFGIDCWLDDCGYTDAYLRLLQRCRTRFACIADHDTVLLAGLEPLVAKLAAGRHDLIGVEERVRLPEPLASAGADGWLRFAPGCTAANFLIIDWQAFKSRWGLGGVFGAPSPGARHFDFDYGIGQRLTRHHYLRPFHTRHYGLGNLLKDGDTPVVWHQWYGSYRTRLNEGAGEFAIAAAGERAFLKDYPQLDLDDLSPAWGPDWVETATTGTHRGLVDEAAHPARRWAGRQVRVLAARIAVRRDRSRLK